MLDAFEIKLSDQKATLTIWKSQSSLQNTFMNLTLKKVNVLSVYRYKLDKE